MSSSSSSTERRMLQSTSVPSRSSQLSKTGESLSQRDSGGPFQHLEFIAEEVHATESPVNLYFVPETSKARPHGTLRDLIRSNARRKPLRPPRNSSQAKLKPRDKENDTTASDQVNLTGSSSSLQRHSEAAIISLHRGPECNAVDPFDTLPIGEPGQTQFLTYHYDTVFAQSDCPVNPRKEWLPFALTDPALLHITLLFSAWQLATLQGKAPTPVVMYHKAESIRCLNKSLLKSDHIATDSTIAVVSCLTKFENLAANAVGVKFHMDGLEALVKSRGGIQALPVDGHARKLATWVDSETSIVMQTQPRFKLASREDEERPEDWSLYSSLAILYEARLFHLTGLQDLSKEMMQVYWAMHNLTSMKNAAIHLTRKVEFESWSDMIERVERRVVALLQSEVVKNGKPKFSILLLFANAAIFHIYMFMRDLPRGLPFYNLLSGRLRESIEAADLAYLNKEYPEMILWILLMGGLGSSGTPNRGWYAKHFAEICMASGLHGGNAISYALSEFLWTELYRSPVTIGFWNDVAMAQGTEGGYGVKALTDHISVAVFNAPPNMAED